MDRWFPGTREVEEVAGSLSVVALNTGGADATAVGRCTTPEGCKAAADATRAAIARGKRDPKVALLGFTRLVEHLTVKSEGASITLALHLDQSEWSDLVMRLSGVIGASMEAILAPSPMDEPTPAPKRKTTK